MGFCPFGAKEETMPLSFRGGINPDEAKKNSRSPLVEMLAPDFVTLPLLQHQGAVAKPLVRVGDRVLKGQIIADGEEGEVSAPIHASVSGVVKAIEPVPTPQGDSVEGIVIENDYKDERSPEVKPFSTPIAQTEPEEIIRFLRNKGIVGEDGLPTWWKIASARGKAKRLIVNGTECEPYLSADHRLLLEKAAEVVGGAKILMKALDCEKAVFAIADDKEDGAEEILKAIRNTPVFSIALFRAKYPQGDERLLVNSLMRKEIPAGKEAWDVGAVAFGVQTCRSVYQAFVTGMPQVTKCLTVGGECVKEGANLSVPLGSSFAQVIARCGGVLKTPKLLIAGGPMRGKAQGTDQVSVTKTVSGILCLDEKKKTEGPCIHCGRCARVCPMGLMPLELYRASVSKKIAPLRRYRADVCNECGCCAYICPSRIELVTSIRRGKALLAKEGEGKE